MYVCQQRINCKIHGASKFYKTKSETTPDQIEWKDVCDSEMGTLERMKCLKVVDESTLPPDAELIDPKWVLKQKFENG